MTFELTVRAGELAICRLPPAAAIPDWAMAGTGLAAVIRTEAELSVVCTAEMVPRDISATSGWRALEVRGPIPHEAIGVLARLSTALATHEISLLALSTYDTDYLLVQGRDLGRAVRALRHDGHVVHTPESPL